MGQAFGEGATWYVRSHNADHLHSAYRNYDKIRQTYGQAPGGMFAGDENCRPGFGDPRQSIETCAMVEMVLSQETLVAISGDLLWADRCEDVAYNSLPAALTADLKALRYLTSPNQVVSDARNHSPGVQNQGPMFHMNPHVHRCCQHNWGHGWPYFAQHLLYATPDDGLAAIFYSDCVVTAKVGDSGQAVTIDQNTKYPFDEQVSFTVNTAEPVAFPLYMRVPGWCEEPQITINGQSVKVDTEPRQFIVVRRTWTSGDSVELTLPMRMSLRTWAANHNSVSVDRGPLTYSLKIGEEYKRKGGSDRWPAWDIHPTSPWNYGLLLDDNDRSASFEVISKDWPADDMPFTHAGVPIELVVRGKRIPQWTLDRYDLCAELQDSPVKSDEPVDKITLIPMGAARLRISAFPVIGDGADAHVWVAPQRPKRLYKATSSHCYHGDTVAAVADDIEPKHSNDQSIDRHTFWPHRGTKEWLQAEFKTPRMVRAAELYWFDDTGRGKCRVPASWRLLYRGNEQWLPVDTSDEFGVARDRYNKVTFKPVTTDALRIEVQLKPDFSGGVLEWNIR